MKFLFQKGNTYAGEPKREVLCNFCEKPFFAYARSLRKGQGKFCTQKCSGLSIRGRKYSEEERLELSKIAKEKNFGKWMKGRKLPKEWCEAIGKAVSKRTVSLETRRKQSELHKGVKSPFWRGGVSTENVAIRNSFEYRQWRRHVFQRDDYTCQACGIRGKTIQADHELPFSLFPLLRFEVLNGRTLCVACHRKTPTFGSNIFKLSKFV